MPSINAIAKISVVISPPVAGQVTQRAPPAWQVSDERGDWADERVGSKDVGSGSHHRWRRPFRTLRGDRREETGPRLPRRRTRRARQFDLPLSPANGVL